MICELGRTLHWHWAGSHDLLESDPGAQTQLLLDGLGNSVVVKLKVFLLIWSGFSFRNFLWLRWNVLNNYWTGAWNVFSFNGTRLGGGGSINLRQNTGIWIVNLTDKILGNFCFSSVRPVHCSHVLIEVREHLCKMISIMRLKIYVVKLV